MNEILEIMFIVFCYILIVGIPSTIALLILMGFVKLIALFLDFIYDITDEIAYKIKEWKEHRENLKRNKKAWGDLWKK